MSMTHLKNSRCQRPGRGATPDEIRDYNEFRKTREYWRPYPLTGVARPNV